MKSRENTADKKEKRQTEADTWIIQMLRVVDKDFKIIDCGKMGNSSIGNESMSWHTSVSVRVHSGYRNHTGIWRRKFLQRLLSR
jgi:hypothetical protein